MSGTQPPPRLHIDQPNALSIDTPRADFGRVFDRRTRRVGHAEWNGQYGWIVFTPDQTQPHLPGWPHQPGVNDDDVTLSFKADRFIPLDHPDLYALIGIAIQGDKLDAIKRARVVFDLGLAEAKSLIEAVLVERSERGPITGVTLKDGRTVVVRQQDDDEAKEREGWSFTSGFPDSGGDDALALDLREKGIEIRTMRATDELRAQDMNEAMADVFRGDAMRPSNTLHVVTGSSDKPKSRFIGEDDFVPGPVMSPEARAKLNAAVAEFAARPDVQVQIREMSRPQPMSMSCVVGTTAKPMDGYTVKRRTLRTDRSAEFGDAFDALEQVLFNLGLGEDYQRVLLASMDKHQPEIHAAIMVLRSRLVRDEDRTATSTP